jgi:hypothetical protein
MLASPIFTVARARPMVRTNSPMRAFCSAKTCSMAEHTAERRDPTLDDAREGRDRPADDSPPERRDGMLPLDDEQQPMI